MKVRGKGPLCDGSNGTQEWQYLQNPQLRQMEDTLRWWTGSDNLKYE